MEAIFYDITEWPEKPYFNTKGTRDKCVLRHRLFHSRPERSAGFFIPIPQ